MNSSHVLIVSVSRSVMPDSLQPHGLQPTRLLRPWDFPGKSTGVGCHCLLWPVQDTQVQSLGGEDPLEEEMATTPKFLPVRVSMDRGAWQATVQEVTRSWTQLSMHVPFFYLLGRD